MVIYNNVPRRLEVARDISAQDRDCQEHSNIVDFRKGLELILEKTFAQLNERASYIEIIYDRSRDQVIEFRNRFIS